jgi:hypothetical protein
VRWRAGCDNSKARGGERWLVREMTTRRRRRAAFWEARHQNLGKGTEGAAWRHWSLASAPMTGEKTEARRRSTAAPFKTVTMRGSSSGGPGLGWPAATHSQWAGARASDVPQHGVGEGLGHRRVGPRHSAGRRLKPVQVYSNEFEFKLTPFQFCSIQIGPS